MPSTIAHVLFPTSSAIASRSGLPQLTRGQWLRFLLLAAFLGNAPDLDLIPASLYPDAWYTIHRWWGHNIFSVFFLIMFGQRLLRRFVSSEISFGKAYAISGLLVVSHLFLDSMGHRTNFGEYPSIPLFFPVSDWTFSLPFHLFPVIELHHSHHPMLAHVLAKDFWVHVIFHEIFFSLVLTGIYATLFWVVRRAIAFAKRDKAPTALRPDKLAA